MDRINSANMATLSPGARRGWQNQSLATGVYGTIFDAEYENGLQEEVLALIEGAGLTPSATTWTQLRQGLLRLFGGNVTTITADLTLLPDMAGILLVDATAGPVVITLPALSSLSASVGGVGTTWNIPFRVLRVDGVFANAVTVQLAAGTTDKLNVGGAVTLSFTVPVGGEWELYGVSQAGFWYGTFKSAQPHGTAYSSTPGAFNWTAPAGVFWVDASMWDAGAGGAYGTSGSPGGGGGGGGFFRGMIPVLPGNTYGFTVGTGGVAGTSSSPTGGNVLTTSALVFEGPGTVTVGTGAKGGAAGGTAGSPGGTAPVVSGLSIGSYMTLPGNPGAPGESVSPYAGGEGGGSFGGSATSFLDPGVGASGTMPGVGGDGGTPNGGTGNAGSAGQGGAIFLRW